MLRLKLYSCPPKRAFIESRQVARVQFKRFILNPDGSVAKEHPWQKNLLVDSGLDLISGRSFPECFSNCKLGSTNDPTQRDSGTTTFSRSGTTVTASAAFFEAADVGRLLKFDSGEEMYVTAFTDSQHVTVGVSGTLSASEGTIWYVDDTTLGNQTKQTSTYGNETGDNGTSWLGNVQTMQRTFIFAAETGTVTYREIGWGYDSGTAILGRAVLPSPDILTAGQQYKVIVRIIRTVTPNTSTPISDFGNNGFVTTGDAVIENYTAAFDFVDTAGGTAQVTFASGLEPRNADTTVRLISDPMTLGSFGVEGSGANLGDKVLTNQGYTPGSFFRDKKGKFGVLEGNSPTVAGMVVHATNSSRMYALKFDDNQEKDGDHTLEITFRCSWGRVLDNGA